MSGRGTSLKERLQAALLLVVYLCASTPLAALSAASIAWMDGEHQVRLSMGSEGLTVLLQHNEQQIQVPSSHIHCLVSDALVLLAEAPTESDSDHVLSFASLKVGGLLPSFNERVEPALPHNFVVVDRVGCSLIRPALLSSLPQLLALPPPHASVFIARSTVFLI